MTRLSEFSSTKKIVYANIEFVDIAGLVRGAGKGEWLGNKFLSHIREVDAIVQVLRHFDDGDVVHVEWDVNPERDLDVINLPARFISLIIISHLAASYHTTIPTCQAYDHLRPFA